MSLSFFLHALIHQFSYQDYLVIVLKVDGSRSFTSNKFANSPEKSGGLLSHSEQILVVQHIEALHHMKIQVEHTVKLFFQETPQYHTLVHQTVSHDFKISFLA